jgi:hypothetical protein
MFREENQRLAGIGLLWALATATAAGQCLDEVQKLTASDAAQEDFFGSAVRIDADTLVVGAPFDEVGGFGNAGAAYVYVRSGSSWVEQAKLTASDASLSAQFGQSLDLQGDELLVGAYFDDPFGAGGAVYAFQRAGTVWSQTQKLIPTGSGFVSQFGRAIAVCGNWAVIGAPLSSGFGEGSIYTYENVAGTWVQRQNIFASPQIALESFGMRVAMDADTMAVGMAAGFNQGRVHLYRFDGSNWNLEQVVTAANGATFFGIEVDLDGDRLAVGSWGSLGGTFRGAAYVFRRNGTQWNQEDQIGPTPAGQDQAYFGTALKLQGEQLFVGAPFGDPEPGHTSGTNPSTGRVYRFKRQPTFGVWMQTAMIDAESAANGDQFGTSMDLCGPDLVVGARFDDDPQDSGSVLHFVHGGEAGSYGGGLAGSGGFVPLLELDGCPVLSSPAAFELSAGLGGAFGVLLISGTSGSAPFRGGTLLVSGTLLVMPHFLSGASGQPGAGQFSLGFTMTDPALSGVDVFAQGLYVDAGAVQGVSLTQGLNLQIE